ncbi:MAG: hypothetical protein MUF38_07635 [Anaerolineae bacterium]|nr:hypothetical protein [Anaerolineae bacterium]
MVNFLRRLFGGGGGGPASRYLTYYVRPKRCNEVVVVRVDSFNDLSELDEGGYFVRKIARGERCPFPAELHITFDKNRRQTEVTVENGEQATEEDYEAWAAAKGDDI